MRRVLIVEDDREIRTLLKDFLVENEYEVVEARNGNEASACIQAEAYDIILMDMMLPYKSGNDLIRELRESAVAGIKDTPVIVISAKSSKDTRLEALKMGADDYIVKPFDMDEVLVRIEVVLRRSNPETKEDEFESILSYNGIEMSLERNSVSYEGIPIKLTAKEMHLLQLFLENPQKTFSKANLYKSVWNDDYIYEDNTINVHMSNLRNKLRKITGEEVIETVWGIGYKLRDDKG